MTLSGHLGTLESAGLIRLAQLEPDLEYLFRHALVQDAAYTSLLPADQKQLHLSVGLAIESLFPDRLEEYAAVLARHFEEADEDQRAHDYFILAGQAALASFANLEAEIQFRRALAIPCCESERVELLDGLGEALYRQSRFEESIQIWREGIDLYITIGDKDGVAKLYARSARGAWLNGDTPESLRLCEEGLGVVAGSADSHNIALLVHEAARAYFFNGIPDKAVDLCHKALEMAVRLDAVDVQADTLATLGVLPNQPPEVVLESLTRAVELAEASGLLQIAVRAHHNLGVMKSGLLGEQRAARQHYLRAAEIARQRGVASEELLSLVTAAGVSLGLGELSDVEEMLLELEKLLEAIADPAPSKISVDSIRAGLLWMRGEWEQSLQLFRICQTEARQRGNLQLLLDVSQNLASSLLELHLYGKLEDLGEVEASLSEVVEISERGVGNTRVWPYCQISILRARQGRLHDAHHWLDGARQAANEQPSFWNDMSLAIAGAELAVAERRWSDATAAAETVAELHARLGTRWGSARTLQDWAEILIRRGESADIPRALEYLRQALETFEKIGAHRHKAMVEDRLQVLRAKAYVQAEAYQADSEELAWAGKIQASFLPEEIPDIPGWQLTASLIPAKETSGDYYDFIHLPGGHIGIVVADVADKGVAAALYMASSRTLIRTFALEHPTNPELVIGEANRRLTLDTHGGLYVTLFYGVLDPDSGVLKYCNAGHNPPYFIRTYEDAEVQTLPRTGIPLGIFEDTTWEQRTLQLSPGDVLVIYTDGVTDTQNAQESFFGEERLLASVISKLGDSAQNIQAGILEDIHEFAENAPQYDDITLVTLVRDAE